jgi:CRP-like cAMP-binding protein
MTQAADEFSPRGRNRVLALLPAETRERLRGDGEVVELAVGDTVYAADEPMRHVYFPSIGVFSMVKDFRGGVTVEVATIGNEGMVGVPVLLGAGSMPVRALCQVPARAVRVPADTFRAALADDGEGLAVCQRYVQALISQIAQSAACNRAHAVRQRCACWLLMTHDRMDQDRFLLTQEFLGQMIGARRSGVSEVAGRLKDDGLIAYSRGTVTVLDRAGLEAASCECYRVVRTEYDRLLA